MGNTARRIEGTGQELKGKIKKGVGRLIGDEQMETAGEAEELTGHAKKEAVKAAERLKGKAEQVIGTAKNRVGRALNNRRMAAEGQAKRAKGHAREQANQ